MNALWQAEAKSNRALVGGFRDSWLDFPRPAGSQGLRRACAPVGHDAEMHRVIPQPDRHIGVLRAIRQQPAGDTLREGQEIVLVIDEPAMPLRALFGVKQGFWIDAGKVLGIEDR